MGDADLDTQVRGQNIYMEAGKNLLAHLPLAMVLTDPNRPDNPIVYVNRAFETLTGYSTTHAVGRNCRFLQGNHRDQPELTDLRKAIADHESITVTLDNYRSDGTRFRNLLMVSPVFDEEGDLYAYIGIQNEVVDPRPADAQAIGFDDQLREMQHRVKNHLQMVSSMIRMQSRETDSKDAYKKLSRRVEALALLYDEFQRPPSGSTEIRYDVVSAGSYVSRVASTVGSLDGRRNVRVDVDVDTVYMRTEQAAQVGLIASEVLSNTLRHAFEGRMEGCVSVSLKQHGGDRVRLMVSDDGVGLGDTNWPKEGNLGAQIVRGLVGALSGELGVVSNRNGTIITVDFDNAVDTSLEKDGRRILTDAGGERAGNTADDGGHGAQVDQDDAKDRLPPA